LEGCCGRSSGEALIVRALAGMSEAAEAIAARLANSRRDIPGFFLLFIAVLLVQLVAEAARKEATESVL
jgi:hypothetical protein